MFWTYAILRAFGIALVLIAVFPEITAGRMLIALIGTGVVLAASEELKDAKKKEVAHVN